MNKPKRNRLKPADRDALTQGSLDKVNAQLGEMTPEELAALTPEQLDAMADELLGHNNKGRKPKAEYPTLSERQRERRLDGEVLMGGRLMSAEKGPNGIFIEAKEPTAKRRLPRAYFEDFDARKASSFDRAA